MASAKDLGLRGEQADRVRKRVGETAERALKKLSDELELYQPAKAKKSRGGRKNYSVDDVVINGVPVDWVERFAKIADQLRRDYVIDESAETEIRPQPQVSPEKRLHQLKSKIHALKAV